MKKNMKNIFRGKGFYVSLMAGAICVVALAAMCLNTFGGNGSENEYLQEEEGQDVAQSEFEEVEVKEPEIEVEPTLIPKSEVETTKTPETAAPKVKEEEKGVTVMESGKNVKNLSFDQEAGVIWPVNGDVLMKYSADSTVYFKTLGQYRSNPALIISAGEGANVCSATDAIVTKIGENEEIGKYVETSIGDDYKIIYGQLENVQVNKGDSLSEGELIGTIAAPTKYYVDEGSNLYFQMKCGDETVDPMIFLE